MIDRETLQRTAATLAPVLDHRLEEVHGERTGFLVFLFDFKAHADDANKGAAAYVSNCRPDALIDTVREVLAYLEAGITSEGPGPRGKS